MKLFYKLISVILMLCLVGEVCAAANAEKITKWGSDGKPHPNPAASKGQNGMSNYIGHAMKDATTMNVANDIVANDIVANDIVVNDIVASDIVAANMTLTSIPTTGNIIDNTKKIAVYVPSMTNPVYQQSTGSIISTEVTYDPLCTAMFFEYNPDYLSDGTIATKLKPANYNLLIIPMREMSNAAATAINTYLANGGSVWFLADPSLRPDETQSDRRITILSVPQYTSYNTITGSSLIYVSNDDITSGLPSSFSPVGGAQKWSFFRAFNSITGTISGFNYKVLMRNGDCSMMIMYENPRTGARAIYSNANMFISGGDCSYFNSQTATKLFLQTKAWLFKMALNKGGVEITYPKSDKQLTVTMDDEIGAPWEGTREQAFFDMETTHGIAPSSVNTFFIIPDSVNTMKSELQFYTANGDTHTLHPHIGTIWDNSQSVSNYQTAIANNKRIINNVNNVNDYGFSSWRFPYTSFCTNSQKAVSNSGFVIDSSSGSYTSGINIGTKVDNNLLFPKQILISSAKANTIEMEVTSIFDLDTGSAAIFYQYYNALMPYLQNVNFPANFVIGAHYQGTGILPEYTNALGQILDASKATGTSYATFDVLAKYITGVRGAKITATTTNGATTVTVVTSKQINDFTIKMASVSIVSATYDGVAIPSSEIRQDSNIKYITHTVGTGTHTFVITA